MVVALLDTFAGL